MLSRVERLNDDISVKESHHDEREIRADEAARKRRHDWSPLYCTVYSAVKLFKYEILLLIINFRKSLNPLRNILNNQVLFLPTQLRFRHIFVVNSCIFLSKYGPTARNGHKK